MNMKNACLDVKVATVPCTYTRHTENESRVEDKRVDEDKSRNELQPKTGVRMEQAALKSGLPEVPTVGRGTVL
jgi:hypothetical protein